MDCRGAKWLEHQPGSMEGPYSAKWLEHQPDRLSTSYA